MKPLSTLAIAPLWLTLVSSALAEAPSQADLARCFVFPKERKVAAPAIQKAIAYLRALPADSGFSSIQDVVCPREVVRLTAGLEATVKAMRIDGDDRDWKGIPRGVEDKEGNVVVHTESKPAKPAPPGMDLAEVSCLYTERDLFLRFKTHGPPARGGVTYWFMISDDRGTRLYDLVLNETRSLLQIYDKGKLTRGVELPRTRCEVRIKNVVEARVSCAALPGLPDTFLVDPTSLDSASNRVNWVTRFPVKSARLAASTTPAYLLARYAEIVDLPAGDLLPLAASVTESFAFDHVEAALRDTVIQDGLAMLLAGRKLAAPLQGLPLESLLAWSNRSLVWGGLFGPLLDSKSHLTREAYEFMFLKPDLLAEVRTHLESAGIGKQTRVKELAESIDRWALSKNRYRWKLEVLKVWADTQGGNWPQIYKDAAKDVEEGRDKVCTVNGKQVYYHTVMSANLDWQLYRKNGVFYGACGEVAVMQMLALKAFGIPDTCFFWRFGKEDALIHTFAGYFDRDAGVWRSAQQPAADLKVKGASVLQWSLPPLTAQLPSYAVTPVGGGADICVGPRTPYLSLSLRDMREKLSAGFPQKQFRELLLRQLKGSPVER